MIESISNAGHSVINHNLCARTRHAPTFAVTLTGVRLLFRKQNNGIFRWYILCPPVVRIVGIFYHIYLQKILPRLIVKYLILGYVCIHLPILGSATDNTINLPVLSCPPALLFPDHNFRTSVEPYQIILW